MGLITNPFNPIVMQKSVKALVLITSLLVYCVSVTAQLKVPVINGIAPDIKKVIADYPARFGNLTGDVITENPQSVEYACNFSFTGAEHSFITRFSAENKKICSFEALMLTTESFDKAKQKFHSLCSQLNNLVVSTGVGGSFKLKGDYEAPKDGIQFTSVIYSPDHTSTSGRLRVEVSLVAEVTEWKVKLLVYDYEKEDNEQGAVRE